jgi:hypothetical protein
MLYYTCRVLEIQLQAPGKFARFVSLQNMRCITGTDKRSRKYIFATASLVVFCCIACATYKSAQEMDEGHYCSCSVFTQANCVASTITWLHSYQLLFVGSSKPWRKALFVSGDTRITARDDDQEARMPTDRASCLSLDQEFLAQQSSVKHWLTMDCFNIFCKPYLAR